jgi:hypothetical protein
MTGWGAKQTGNGRVTQIPKNLNRRIRMEKSSNKKQLE